MTLDLKRWGSQPVLSNSPGGAEPLAKQHGATNQAAPLPTLPGAVQATDSFSSQDVTTGVQGYAGVQGYESTSSADLLGVRPIFASATNAASDTATPTTIVIPSQAEELDRLLPADRQAFQVAMLQNAMRANPQAPEGYSLIAPSAESTTLAENSPPLQRQAELQEALNAMDGVLLIDSENRASLYLQGTRGGNLDDLQENLTLLTRNTQGYTAEAIAHYRTVVDVLEQNGMTVAEVVGFSQGGAMAQLLPAEQIYTYAAPAMGQARLEAEAAGLYEANGFSNTLPTVAVHLFDSRDPIGTNPGRDLTLGGQIESGGLTEHVSGSQDGGSFALDRGGTLYGPQNLQQSHFGSLDELGNARNVEEGLHSLPNLYERNIRNTLSFDAGFGLLTDSERERLSNPEAGEQILGGIQLRF
ncbi:MAG: hypothetical protein SFZ03_01330 [Candidatus Melainabacteria bacterium]|nr:hypothetical protein [Candidatus Melainabacteria bacterium]